MLMISNHHLFEKNNPEPEFELIKFQFDPYHFSKVFSLFLKNKKLIMATLLVIFGIFIIFHVGNCYKSI